MFYFRRSTYRIAVCQICSLNNDSLDDILESTSTLQASQQPLSH